MYLAHCNYSCRLLRNMAIFFFFFFACSVIEKTTVTG